MPRAGRRCSWSHEQTVRWTVWDYLASQAAPALVLQACAASLPAPASLSRAVSRLASRDAMSSI